MPTTFADCLVETNYYTISSCVWLCIILPACTCTFTPCHPSIITMCMNCKISPYPAPTAVVIGLTEGSLPSSQPLVPPSWCRCIEEDAGLLDLEPLPGFPKGLELHKPADEPFDVKDIFNTSLESEALKETLLRQAKTQVCLCTHLRHKVRGHFICVNMLAH